MSHKSFHNSDREEAMVATTDVIAMALSLALALTLSLVMVRGARSYPTHRSGTPWYIGIHGAKSRSDAVVEPHYQPNVR